LVLLLRISKLHRDVGVCVSRGVMDQAAEGAKRVTVCPALLCPAILLSYWKWQSRAAVSESAVAEPPVFLGLGSGLKATPTSDSALFVLKGQKLRAAWPQRGLAGSLSHFAV
jgi:hypothetical protein